MYKRPDIKWKTEMKNVHFFVVCYSLHFFSSFLFSNIRNERGQPIPHHIRVCVFVYIYSTLITFLIWSSYLQWHRERISHHFMPNDKILRISNVKKKKFFKCESENGYSIENVGFILLSISHVRRFLIRSLIWIKATD